MVAPILDHMTALSDATRCRMLMLLEKQELTVSELCAVLQMPQSTVSRHLNEHTRQAILLVLIVRILHHQDTLPAWFEYSIDLF